MKNYLVEIIRDSEGVVTDRKIHCKVRGKTRPTSGEFHIVVAPDYPIDKCIVSEVDGELIITEDTKSVQIEALYNTMVEEVEAAMQAEFGTTNPDSAAAYAATYEAMLARPANYVDVSLGLADEAAVTAYASGKLATADAYGLYRLKRIAQYQADKQAVLDA